MHFVPRELHVGRATATVMLLGQLGHIGVVTVGLLGK